MTGTVETEMTTRATIEVDDLEKIEVEIGREDVCIDHWVSGQIVSDINIPRSIFTRIANIALKRDMEDGVK